MSGKGQGSVITTFVVVVFVLTAYFLVTEFRYLGITQTYKINQEIMLYELAEDSLSYLINCAGHPAIAERLTTTCTMHIGDSPIEFKGYKIDTLDYGTCEQQNIVTVPSTGPPVDYDRIIEYPLAVRIHDMNCAAVLTFYV